MSQTTREVPVKSAHGKVPTRRMSFEDSLQDLPRHFADDGDLILSHLAAALSAVFPDGEDYFVRSVSAAQHLTDPGLIQDVKGFIGQEEMHGREHRVLNERLAELGYPTREIGSYVRWLFSSRERIRNKRLHLAFTAALEHYTATLAETLLSDPDARAVIGDEGVRSLLLWHAHKALPVAHLHPRVSHRWQRSPSKR